MINLTILILEDDIELLKRLTNILKREVLKVYSFSSSLQAYKEIPKIMPNLIISDIVMDDMTGLEMYKKLKEDGIEIPIILASAFSEKKYFIEAVKLRVNHFLVKPINVDELLEELIKLESKLKLKADSKKKEELLVVQSKMAEMGDMINNIAHQWKQPLNTLSICTSGMEIEEKYNQEYIDVIKNSIKYMNETINDFQHYFEPNKIKNCFNISKTIKKVENLVSSQLKIKNIQIILDIDQSINLCSYENELIQVLINLYKNSIDELQKKDYEKFMFIDVKENSSNIIINIKDNAGGINIQTNDINNIFDEYFTTKGSKGTGIGLYMSRMIVENKLEGTINVENVKYEHNNKLYLGAKFIMEIQKNI